MMCDCDTTLINTLYDQNYSLDDICRILIFFDGIHDLDCKYSPDIEEYKPNRDSFNKSRKQHIDIAGE